MISPYRRRRPSLIRNFWIYRRLVGLSMILGLLLWFIWANNAPVTVAFPFGLGSLSSRLGLVILASTLTGAMLTGLATTVVLALRRFRAGPSRIEDETNALPDDRPPADYASRASEAPGPQPWT